MKKLISDWEYTAMELPDNKAIKNQNIVFLCLSFSIILIPTLT
ncbi:MAG: hypothetical protein P5702_08835 [Limnospira sp. PMC 1291.21]|nr:MULTISPECIES: hypothetical protein [Limnospira]EKD11627.1 hypothetical protein SPLC1_S010240 [Arthrospira platensis C1]MDY7053320.1 hypothetical protein [Limnospira fusiformis LS22]MDT9177591.1 hypothetical protein [Limnospira sp. PMC 1238.20]MDT9192847.1 hypothetical protein [Limnospira sp. PMC 1245.20]MDT9203214.1 hypothetical protein [Limnospira sp. PMC 1243.20]